MLKCYAYMYVLTEFIMPCSGINAMPIYKCYINHSPGLTEG